MGQISPLYATQTATPNVIPISDGSGLLDAWVTPALANPMTSPWDIIVGGVGGTPGRLGVGPLTYVLTVGSGGVVDWEAPGGGFVNPMTTGQDLIVGGAGGSPGRVGVGGLGQVLTVGSGGVIDWETPSGGGGGSVASDIIYSKTASPGLAAINVQTAIDELKKYLFRHLFNSSGPDYRDEQISTQVFQTLENQVFNQTPTR